LGIYIPELKLDIPHYKQLSWLEGQALYSAGDDQKSWLVVKGMPDQREKTSVLPLRLVENQASIPSRMSALAYWRYGYGILATRR
jgi:hypothetical protein